MPRVVLSKSDKLAARKNNKTCENLTEYCLNSSLHGLKYCGTSTLSFFERIFFGISFTLVMILAVYFISNIWQKWNESPVIVSGNAKFTTIKDIPFPSVTICNMNQIKKSFKETLTESRDKIILDSICTLGDTLNNNDAQNFEGKWTYVRQFLLNASQPCANMMKICRFGTKKIDCDKNFTSVLTDEGLCCSFNAGHPNILFNDFQQSDHVDEDIDSIDYMTWSPETGYDSKDERSAYPNAVPGAGSHFGLSLLLDADVANYYCSSTSSSGFKVLLHSPIEIPRIANFGFSLSTGLETKVVIFPKISEASQLIRKVPKQQRQCLFANENNLSYYRMYSKKNCESECSSKLTEEACGCTLYYMPRKFSNESKICNRAKASCYEEILYKIQNTMDQNLSCNHCLPACYEISYNREISSSVLGNGSFQVVEQMLKNYSSSYIRENLAIVHIFFSESAYSGFTKNELIGFTEFLSNTGGLLGLFMGFSVISLIEIIYFLSIRPYCSTRRAESEKKFNQTRSYVSNFHVGGGGGGGGGCNKQASISGHANVNDHHYMCPSKASPLVDNYESFHTKLISGGRYMKTKASSVWNSIVELYQPNDEGHMPSAPYPYLD